MLLNFFATCNKIGAFTLGGGYAMIPDHGTGICRQEQVDGQTGVYGHHGSSADHSGNLCHRHGQSYRI